MTAANDGGGRAPALHVVGVRHHSPACARLVEATIRAVKPKHVLIEGPADMNTRLDELLLPHALPIAIFTYYRDDENRTHASFTPFCETSPEWTALKAGHEVGAQVRFMDLPAWHDAFHDVRNRYSDGDRRTSLAVQKLCKRFGVDGMDALWDHLFEGDLDLEVLRERLATYFKALRADDPAGPRDEPREQLMREFIAAAAADGGDVVVVCGGFHAPALAPVPERAPGDWPVIEQREGARSYLVPYSFFRLDAFTGYESGMPSPAFYQAVLDDGPRAAPEKLLRAIVDRLRAKNLHVSSADLIAASTMAEGLARLRGHSHLLRTDLLDGLAAALVKDALDTALPWTSRGRISRDTDALVVEMVAALSGDREGRLAPKTPQPPLVADAWREMDALDVAPRERPRELELRLDDAKARARSRVLHRLRVLEIPGFVRTAGPKWTTDPVVVERWEIKRTDLLDASLIEAAQHGASLEGAASSKLADVLADPDLSLAKVAQILGEAAFIGVHTLTERALSLVMQRAQREMDFTSVGGALTRVLGIWRHDSLFGAQRSDALGQALAACHVRGLWLLEHVSGATSPADKGFVEGVAALRDVMKHAPELADRDSTVDVWERRANAPDAPPAVRGACLGALWSTHALDDDTGRARSIRAVRSMAQPSTLGDFCAGLFALAREEVVGSEEVLRVVDELVAGFSEQDLMIALPSLRLAFSIFPPREKSEIADRVAMLHGAAPGKTDLLTLPTGAEELVRAAALDDDVDRVLMLHGLART